MNILYKKTGLNEEKIKEKAILKFGLKEEEGRIDTGDLFKAFNLLDIYYSKIEKELRKRDYIKKEVIKAINKIKQRKGIATSSMRKTVLLWMKIYPVRRYFNFIYSSDDAGCNKDDIIYWEKLIRKERLNPKTCIIVGNNLKEDINIPSKLGFKCMLIKDFLKLS